MKTLEKELETLADLLRNRLAEYFNIENKIRKLHSIVSPESSALDVVCQQYNMSDDERMVLLAGLVPHFHPDFFNSIIQEFLPGGGEFAEFGGVKGTNHRGILPTGETLLFILAGMDITKRLQAQDIFGESGTLHKNGILYLEAVREGEPVMSGRIIVSQEWVDKILFDREYQPRFGMDFPARRINTEMTWEDLVLHPRTAKQIQHISTWLEYHHLIQEDDNLRRKIKPGYRVLLYGPPGTGKTLTATLLGRQFNKDVYRVDLSQIVSKYIGETEKNLENVFKRAESRNWILFFDEADALFGKRTNVQSSHDKYANQEVSYLLQRVEDYAGLLILSSNFRNNLDDAFIRRFHEVVHFPMPDAHHRRTLWQKSIPSTLPVDESVDLGIISEKYELSGAAILSVIHYSTLRSYERRLSHLTNEDIMEGIRREFTKEEKSV